MSAFLLLYFALLALWPPLLWPALRLRGAARMWLLVVVAVGVVADIYEIYVLFVWAPINPIRLDIPLISVVLLCSYTSAALVLFLVKWRKAVTGLALVLVVIGGGMGYDWARVSRESERVRQAFEAGNALLFDAKFRTREAYERYFGPFAGAGEDHPVGHWRAREKTAFTRLIINAKGEVWLFYRCGETECHYGPDTVLLQTHSDAARRWEATLKPRAGAPLAVGIEEKEGGELTLLGPRGPVEFQAAPPPIDPTPASQSLDYLGAFSAVACRGAHARVRQLWLWREGPELYAVGIFRTLTAGSVAGFVHPLLLGAGARSDDRWTYEWEENGASRRATVTLDGGQVGLTLARNRDPAERLALKPEPVFRDEVVELAPLTGKEEWHYWFDNVLVGHFATASIPAC